MHEYIFLMYGDAPEPVDDGAAWERYFAALRASGRFAGGSAIGGGHRIRKGEPPTPPALPIDGFIRVQAESLDDARAYLAGNPVYEAGGTIEIRELTPD
jgi:hypothetical protein